MNFLNFDERTVVSEEYIDNLVTINMLKNITLMLEHIEYNDMKNIILTLRKLKNDVSKLEEAIYQNIEGNLYK